MAACPVGDAAEADGVACACACACAAAGSGLHEGAQGQDEVRLQQQGQASSCRAIESVAHTLSCTECMCVSTSLRICVSTYLCVCVCVCLFGSVFTYITIQQVAIPDADYKAAVEAIAAEKARYGLESIAVEPRKEVSLKDLVEG